MAKRKPRRVPLPTFTDDQLYDTEVPRYPAGETRARSSLRWHFDFQGRRFILYGDRPCAYASLVFFRGLHGDGEPMPDLVASGYYDRYTNTIVDSQDGPAIIQDGRKTS